MLFLVKITRIAIAAIGIANKRLGTMSVSQYKPSDDKKKIHRHFKFLNLFLFGLRKLNCRIWTGFPLIFNEMVFAYYVTVSKVDLADFCRSGSGFLRPKILTTKIALVHNSYATDERGRATTRFWELPICLIAINWGYNFLKIPPTRL